MKKNIAIVGAGISGLVFANFLKKDSNYNFTIFEKNSSLDLSSGYGVQLAPNSIFILNKIIFHKLKTENKFNPEKIDFYSFNNHNKICELDIGQFNKGNINYTTIKRSILIEFLKENLYTDSIQFNKKIEKINYSNSKVELTFESGIVGIFDYLVVADGVFSLTKSILFNANIEPKYTGSFAIRTFIKKQQIKFVNEKNISLFLGPKIHLVVYPINNRSEFNLVTIIRKSINQKDFFNNNENAIKFAKEFFTKKDDKFINLFNNLKDIECFPTFVSDKIYQADKKNIFFLGDAFCSTLPTFAQGASQSIESAYELFNTFNENNFDKYFKNRVNRLKMINYRAKLNYFIFHLSNPILVSIRNFILKILVNKKSFLSKYLDKIYNQKHFN